MTDIAELRDWATRQEAKMKELYDKDPTMHPVTAIVLAGDLISAEDAEKKVAEGLSPIHASVFVGSFARFQFVVKYLKAGKIPRQTFDRMLPELWCACDPQDDNLEYLKLWHAAWLANKRRYLRHGKALSNAHGFAIYRGEVAATQTYGFAWTLDYDIALAFAKGRGERRGNACGVVYAGFIKATKIYGYITERAEAEVIVDPQFITNVHIVTQL